MMSGISKAYARSRVPLFVFVLLALSYAIITAVSLALSTLNRSRRSLP